jgi:hypothetical protein
MPFKSQSQQAYMYARHPQLAAEFQKETPPNTKLPKKVDKKKSSTTPAKPQGHW